MIVLTFYIFLLAVAVFFALLSAWSDVKTLTIPNENTIVVGVAFILWYGVLFLFGYSDLAQSFLYHLLGGLIVFLVTLGLFALKMIGAADSKLATAYGLWAGLLGLPAFLIYTTLAGGLLGAVSLAVKKYKPFQNPTAGSWFAKLQAGESKVPYGIAIAVGAIGSFIHLGYFSPSVLGSFLN